ncbi:MAG: hypothetical protein JXA54_01770 [Candidatus Heimdallarchaeota archaeon]|nr:hypothetical protein [Candidatus Heimdallarchaeota archaeon]
MNNYTIYFLINSGLSVATCVLFLGIIIRSFIKKRTMSTLLLGLTFLSTTIAEILQSISFFMEAFASTFINITTVVGILTYTSYILFASNIVLVYVFGDRLFMRDNDLVRLIYIVGFTFSVAFPAGLVFKNILTLHDPSLYTIVSLEAAELSMIFPPKSYGLLVIMGLLGISAFLRIVFEAFKLQRSSKDPIVRKGFQFIWQGTFLWYLGYSGLYGLLWFIPFVATNSIMSVTMFTFKLVFSDIIGFTLLYLGLIMPSWIRRRYQKKSWISQAYSGEIKVTPTTDEKNYYIAPKKSNELKVTEITEP